MSRSASTRRRMFLSNSIAPAPAPYKPPVFWTLCLIVATAISAVMFVCALIWLILSPLLPPTGMP